MTEEGQGKNTFKAGYFGKIPCRGDFISRWLPREFLDPWDYWLQNAVSASRTHLSEGWLDTYLTSPIWRFFLSPGICGESSWIGAWMPSVDKVGRYFPFTLVLPLPGSTNPFRVLDSATHCFFDMEKLILSTLEEEFFDLSSFDQSVACIGRDFAAASLNRVDDKSPVGRLTATNRWHIPLTSADAIMQGYPEMLWHLLQRRFSAYSLWWTNGSEMVKPGLSISDGLPAAESFTAFLDGRWQSASWEDWPMASEPAEKEARFSGPGQATLSPGVQSEVEKPVSHLQWSSASATEAGCVRTINEDAFLDFPEKGFWLVADGMGGHDAGDFASALIVSNLSDLEAPAGLEQFVENVTLRLRKVNQLLLNESVKRGNDTVGSTVAMLLAFGERAAVLWAGDSRVYRNRKGLTMQISRDHSAVNAHKDLQMQNGEIAAAPVNTNVITRAVGAENTLEMDVKYLELQEGDTFLLCSDGLNKEVSDEEISDIMNVGDCNEVTKTLLDLAMKRGARDNVTVITSRVMSVKEEMREN